MQDVLNVDLIWIDKTTVASTPPDRVTVVSGCILKFPAGRTDVTTSSCAGERSGRPCNTLQLQHIALHPLPQSPAKVSSVSVGTQSDGGSQERLCCCHYSRHCNIIRCLTLQALPESVRHLMHLLMPLLAYRGDDTFLVCCTLACCETSM